MLSGLCPGLAFAARSFDAILLLAPTLGQLLWNAPGRRLRLIAGVVAGGSLAAVALLWFDDAATGSALKLPFSLFSSQDTLGFGVHRLYPEEPGQHFGLAQGWDGLWRHLSLLGTRWELGGFFLLVLGGLAFARRLVPPACIALLAGGLVLTAGYLFFWGTWNAAVVWGTVQYLGPYYVLPLRPIYQLRLLGEYGKHPHSDYGATLQRMTTIAGPTVTVSVRARLPESIANAQLIVTLGTDRQVLNLPVDQDADVPLAFSAGGSCQGTRLGPVLLPDAAGNRGRGLRHARDPHVRERQGDLHPATIAFEPLGTRNNHGARSSRLRHQTWPVGAAAAFRHRCQGRPVLSRQEGRIVIRSALRHL
jgi:hypothetical protein